MADPRGHPAAGANGGRRGDAFTTMFRENYGGIYAYALRRASPEDADEVVAETFVVAWRRWDDAPRDRLRPWLYGIARRVLANQRRSRARHQRLLQRAEAAGESPAEEVRGQSGLGGHDDSTLSRAWRQLREEDREILRLAAWEQLDHSGIAEVIGCSRGAARVRLHRARKRLRAHMQGKEGLSETGEADD